MQQQTEAAGELPPVEKFYSIRELGRLWNLNAALVRRKFEGRPGVMKMGTDRRSAWRVPASLVLEVMVESGYSLEQAARILRKLE